MKIQKVVMLAGVALLVYMAWQARPKPAGALMAWRNRSSIMGDGESLLPQYAPAWSDSSDYDMAIEDRGLKWT